MADKMENDDTSTHTPEHQKMSIPCPVCGRKMSDLLPDVETIVIVLP
ncbi:MAG: hypothetical protein HXS48_23095 [Theionarchaea archaeon]|nr:hypothetical protein [Theionarchaea archaeon]